MPGRNGQRTAAIIGIFLLGGLAGCLQPLSTDGAPMAGIEMRVNINDGAWTNHARIVVEGPGIESNDDPLMEPGGGETHILTIPEISATASAMLYRPEYYEGDFAAWYLVPVTTNIFTTPVDLHRLTDQQEPDALLPANEVFSFELDREGLWGVGVAIRNSAGEVIMTGSEIHSVAADVSWVVEQQVYPQRERQTSEPNNYDEMVDIFRASLAVEVPFYSISTEYRPTSGLNGVFSFGRDVDVGARASEDEYISCEGSTLGDDPAQESMVSPIEVNTRVLEFMVGAMPDGCSSSGWYYENDSSVTYTATLETGYGLAFSQAA